MKTLYLLPHASNPMLMNERNGSINGKLKLMLASVHITFTFKRKKKRKPHQLPQYHLDRRLTFTHHIAAKIKQINLKPAQLHWLIGP